MDDEIMTNLHDETERVDELLRRYARWPAEPESVARDVARRLLAARNRNEELGQLCASRGKEIAALTARAEAAEAEAARLREEIEAVSRAGLRDAQLALELYEERREKRNQLNQEMITFVMRGGLDVWGVEFVQWFEGQLDGLQGFDRVGKSVTDDHIYIRLRTKTADGNAALARHE